MCRLYTAGLIDKPGAVSITRRYRPVGLDAVENLENYRVGGFHPVRLGDSFANGRYRIVHKLGYGGFSTVWLARDELLHGYVALKIIMSEASVDESELRILQHLSKEAFEHPGREYLSTLKDTFTSDGPNGPHTCLVSDVAGPSVIQLAFSPGRPGGCRRLRAALARKVALQATQALAYLHATGVVHGDFTTANILFRIANLDQWSPSDIYERLGQPVTAPLLTLSGSAPDSSAPGYVVEPAFMLSLAFRYLTESIQVVDFGDSFFASDRSIRTPGTPLPYSAPELVFDEKADMKTDVWALGCCLYEIRAGAAIFTAWNGGEDEVIRQWVQTLGKMPDRWWRQWGPRHDYFDDDTANPRNVWKHEVPLAQEYTVHNQIRDIGAEDEVEGHGALGEGDLHTILEPPGLRLSEEEVACFEDLLGRILKYVPEERATAQELLDHPWFTTLF